tara:strand:- start:1612 stop:2451 length:840 start_codon:yes stop_codon:yes gene_type:complete
MKVIGVGSAGCNIADCFAEYPQYQIYKIDNDLPKQKGNLCVPKCESVEEYEEKCPSFKNFFRGIKTGDEVIFVVCGASAISAISLRALETITRANIRILYIAPDRSLVSNKLHTHERVVFGVLQEYARSGVFERMYIVKNDILEEILDNVPVVGYYDVLNNLIVSTVHMINVYENNDPVYRNSSESLRTTKISTIGIVKIKENQENLFYPLDTINEKCYIYAINGDRLETDGKLFSKLKKKIVNNKELELMSNVQIHSTDYGDDYGYVIASSSEIQTQE